jgi:hypothetical protein
MNINIPLVRELKSEVNVSRLEQPSNILVPSVRELKFTGEPLESDVKVVRLEQFRNIVSPLVRELKSELNVVRLEHS